VVCRLSGLRPTTGKLLKAHIFIVTVTVTAVGDSQTAFDALVRYLLQ